MARSTVRATGPISVTDRAADPRAWAAAEGFGGALLSLGSAVLLAALLGPAEVGTAAVALAVSMIVNLPLARLFPDALVQRPSLTELHGPSAAWVGLGLGLLCGVGLFVLARPAAGALGHPEAEPLLRWLAPTCAAAAISGVAQGLLLRQGRLRRLALVALGSQGVAGLAGIAAAWGGLGARAMALQYGLGLGLAALSYLALGAVPLRLRAGRREACELLRFGLPCLGAQLLHQGGARLFLLLAALRLDPAGLGALHLGFRLVDAARDVAAGIIQRLGLPAMARAQARQGLAAAYRDTARLVGLHVLPPFVGLALTATLMVPALLGRAWAEASVVVALNAALAVVVLARVPAAVALTASGRGGSLLANQALLFALTLAAALFVPIASPAGAALAWFGSGLVGSACSLWLLSRRMGLSLGGQLSPFLPGVGACLSLGAFVLLWRYAALVPAGSHALALAGEAGSGAAGWLAALVAMRLGGTTLWTRGSVVDAAPGA